VHCASIAFSTESQSRRPHDLVVEDDDGKQRNVECHSGADHLEQQVRPSSIIWGQLLALHHLRHQYAEIDGCDRSVILAGGDRRK
jgi:hypothetical protein